MVLEPSWNEADDTPTFCDDQKEEANPQTYRDSAKSKACRRLATDISSLMNSDDPIDRKYAKILEEYAVYVWKPVNAFRARMQQALTLAQPKDDLYAMMQIRILEDILVTALSETDKYDIIEDMCEHWCEKHEIDIANMSIDIRHQLETFYDRTIYLFQNAGWITKEIISIQ